MRLHPNPKPPDAQRAGGIFYFFSTLQYSMRTVLISGPRLIGPSICIGVSAGFSPQELELADPCFWPDNCFAESTVALHGPRALKRLASRRCRIQETSS
jgi:hypothetical protein